MDCLVAASVCALLILDTFASQIRETSIIGDMICASGLHMNLPICMWADWRFEISSQ